MAYLLPVATGATGHDFAACVKFLETFAEDTVVRRPITEVPKHLRHQFDGAAKVLVIGADPSRSGEIFFVTDGDFSRDAGVGPLHLRVTRIGDDVSREVEALDWGRPHTLVARRRASPHAIGTVLSVDSLRDLKVGDVIERFGVYYVLDRSRRARPPAWQFEAYRFDHAPQVGDRANNAATLGAGEYVWAGEAVIGRHANVIAIDRAGVPRTRLVRP